MVGRPDEEAADQRLRPLRAAVVKVDRDGTNLATTSLLTHEGSNPKPYTARLWLDLPLDERCLANPKPRNRLLTPKVSISIGTWNVRTLHQNSRTEFFVKEMKRFSWEIIGIAETQWTGNGTKSIEN